MNCFSALYEYDLKIVTRTRLCFFTDTFSHWNSCWKKMTLKRMIENICGYQLNIFVASFSCQHARAWWCLCSVQPLCLSLCVKRPNRILQMNHQNPLVSPKSSVHPQSPVCTNSAKTDSSLTDEILITTKMKKLNSFRIHKYNLGIQKNNLKDGLSPCTACQVYQPSKQKKGHCFLDMMTSSNGCTFCVTGHLCGEFIGPRWIPHTKASDAELLCFLWSVPE